MARINQKDASKYQGPSDKIIIGAYPNKFPTLIWVAENREYFKEYGLDLTIKKYDSGVACVKALMAGHMDIATAAEYVFVRNSFKNRNPSILASSASIKCIQILVRRVRGSS